MEYLESLRQEFHRLDVRAAVREMSITKLRQRFRIAHRESIALRSIVGALIGALSVASLVGALLFASWIPALLFLAVFIVYWLSVD
jgi:hypothetical protein